MSLNPDKTLVLDVAGVKVTLGAEPTVGQHYRTLALGQPDASSPGGWFAYQRSYVAAVANIDPVSLDNLPQSEVPRLFAEMFGHWTETGFFAAPPSADIGNQPDGAAAAQ